MAFFVYENFNGILLADSGQIPGCQDPTENDLIALTRAAETLAGIEPADPAEYSVSWRKRRHDPDEIGYLIKTGHDGEPLAIVTRPRGPSQWQPYCWIDD